MSGYKQVVLQARRPGGEWGIRSRMLEQNARQSLSDGHRLHLDVEGVKSLGMELARTWADSVHDDTEYRVVTL
jgi:hypothetical protein